MSIVLFSRPVHTGKTTELQAWLHQNPEVHGLLMPDGEGGRYFELWPEKERFPAFFRPESEFEKLEIGRFSFSSSSFRKANTFLHRKAIEKPAIMVVDELGKLELKNLGLATGIRALVQAYRSAPEMLILVVRTSLVEEALEKFDLQPASIMDSISWIE